MVYIGIVPLALADQPIFTRNFAWVEAHSCKQYWWRHLTYSNIFGLPTDACIGQTWYYIHSAKYLLSIYNICIVLQRIDKYLQSIYRVSTEYLQSINRVSTHYLHSIYPVI